MRTHPMTRNQNADPATPTKEEVRRFKQEIPTKHGVNVMLPDAAGPFIRYDDYAALQAENERLRKSRDEVLEEAAKVVECLLPEGGSAEPQDKTDRLIDATRRSDVTAIRALKGDSHE